MEGPIKKDQGPFQQYEANHLYHWYGLFLSFLHLSKYINEFPVYIEKNEFSFHPVCVCISFLCANICKYMVFVLKQSSNKLDLK